MIFDLELTLERPSIDLELTLNSAPIRWIRQIRWSGHIQQPFHRHCLEQDDIRRDPEMGRKEILNDFLVIMQSNERWLKLHTAQIMPIVREIETPDWLNQHDRHVICMITCDNVTKVLRTSCDTEFEPGAISYLKTLIYLQVQKKILTSIPAKYHEINVFFN